MTVCRLEKQKEQDQVCTVNKEQGNVNKPDCSDEFRIRVAKAIEAEDLCYNYETGFHYMKQ